MDKANLKDHRQIGQELDLFSFHDVAPGAVFWHPKGWIIYQEIVNLLRSALEKDGYQEIKTPIMIKNSLFKRSGHWQHFGQDNMFNLSVWEDDEIKMAEDAIKKRIKEIEKEILALPEEKVDFLFPIEIKNQRTEIKILVSNKKINQMAFSYSLPINYSLKPMNCPESTLIYNARTRSYRDLPLKFSQFDILHRRELSGVLGGLFRLREFSIDDAHHFVRPDQIQEEIHKLILLVVDFYKSFNFKPELYFSTKPDKAMGDPKLWKKAEDDLEKALKDAKVEYGIKKKEGAFYGPKIDIHIKDSQNRDWQLATIQLDFQIPEKLKLEYIDSEGKPKRPIIIHRAITGSLERFIGILTEHYAGVFPLWLAPVQVMVIPIADRHNEYASSIVRTIELQGIRVKTDTRPERLQAKIRDAALQKVPYLGIIGDREVQSSKFKVQSYGESLISVRTRQGKDLGQIKLSEFITRLKEEIDKKI